MSCKNKILQAVKPVFKGHSGERAYKDTFLRYNIEVSSEDRFCCTLVQYGAKYVCRHIVLGFIK